MSEEKKDNLEEGLEINQVETVTTKTKKVKIQTPEELAVIVAGIELIKKFGVSEKFALVVDITPFWNGDKEELSAKKEELIKAFEGSDKLKDYVDGEFQEELNGILGTAKIGSILNNFKSFYARRPSSKKAKLTQVNIAGTIHNVNTDYFVSIGDLPKEEKRELLLKHPDTKVVENIPEIL